MTHPRFYYDFGSPYAYLAAERIEAVVGPVDWRPVFLVGVFKATGRRSWVYSEDAGREWAEVERRLADRGLPPVALCPDWADRLIPSSTPARSTLMAQRVAQVALEHDRIADFSRGLYRAVFQRAADLTDPETVVGVAEAAGVPAAEAARAIDDPARQEQVRAATAEAVAAGVSGVPTVVVDDQVFWGDDQLEDVAATLRRAS